MNGAATPAVYTIPPGVAFVDALACGLYERAGRDPLALSRMTIFLPTRRACRTLHEAFLRFSDGASMLLPRMLALGDLDAEELMLSGESVLGASGLDPRIPPAMPEVRRQLLLARLIRRWGEAGGGRDVPTVDRAARLATELARLLDQVETEGLSFDGLAELAPERYADHWRQTLEFLKIVTHWWPAIEAEEGGVGPAERRRRLLEAQADAWRHAPPADPVIAAGSMGSIPATTELLDVIARLPQGCVVLPGLDRSADEATWMAVRTDPTHPQHNMARLLARLDIGRETAADWPLYGIAQTPPARAEIIHTASKPAGNTPDWRDLARGDPGRLERLKPALDGVRRLDCPGLQEEAAAIALMMRQALEDPGRTAALVTPDRGLARRVAVELKRWNIFIDDSGGTPLNHTAPGTFLRLTAQMLAEGLTPLSLLAALKHPLAAGGLDPGTFRARVRALERAVLRGPRPPSGFEGLLGALEAARGEARTVAWLRHLKEAAAEAEAALASKGMDFARLVDTHMRLAETLAASRTESGPARLWAGEAGEAMAALASELTRTGDAAPPIDGARYPALLDAIMAEHVVRPRYGRHPRLAIWGLLEARLQRCDLMILGGLNEGTWPVETDAGPWLSRPMRLEFGLPPVERRIGLMAHDFVQAFCAPQVVLTRATRVDGTPTVPSRWLLRLDAVLEALGLEPLRTSEAPWLEWVRKLDEPAEIRETRRPAPTPPYAARPRQLSATKVETWMRDPYALYAQVILGLAPLPPVDQDPGVAERGVLVHEVLEKFVKSYPEILPEDPEAELLRLGREVFNSLDVKPGVRAFWWPRFRRIARWVAEQETARPGTGCTVLAECKGALEVEGLHELFELTAKADRIECRPDGTLIVVDYKTGAVPSDTAVTNGFAPQLPLEAAIAQVGGFAGLPASAVRELAYWRLTGGTPAGELKRLRDDPAALAELALAGLEELVRRFDDPATPYLARPHPAWALRYSDYDHLARVQEWSAGTMGEET